MLALCLGTLAASAALAADKPGPYDWPQWRGQNRDGKSPETGLLKSWPKDGPAKLWTAKGPGHRLRNAIRRRRKNLRHGHSRRQRRRVGAERSRRQGTLVHPDRLQPERAAEQRPVQARRPIGRQSVCHQRQQWRGRQAGRDHRQDRMEEELRQRLWLQHSDLGLQRFRADRRRPRDLRFEWQQGRTRRPQD